MATLLGAVLVAIWRSERRFRQGYLMALDHVEQMTHGRITGRPLSEVLATLRDETHRG
ncbi:MAG: hypothetical protein M3Y26_00235 [Actinomycetota bacterium]|nr:hypothetical protein [Actinomycetota bacterium]